MGFIGDFSGGSTSPALLIEVNTMKELLHKAWLFGAGVFDFTKDKVEAWSRKCTAG